jgi:hypothetical protein
MRYELYDKNGKLLSAHAIQEFVLPPEQAKLEKKKEAFRKKGWRDAMDIIEDMAERGAETVLAEIKALKEKEAKAPRG